MECLYNQGVLKIQSNVPIFLDSNFSYKREKEGISEICYYKIKTKLKQEFSNGEYIYWFEADELRKEVSHQKEIVELEYQLKQFQANLDYISMMSGISIPTEEGV